MSTKGLVTVNEYTFNGSFSVNYYMELLERVQSSFGEILVGKNDMFGNMLFFDNEIQITSLDFARYHELMISLAVRVRLDSLGKVLIIGDGDGGFTQYPFCSEADFVERDVGMMKIGEKYFNANWQNVGKLFIQSIEDFKPTAKYDTIFLAITDDFNRASLLDQLIRFKGWLNEGGCLVSQVGCSLDYSYDKILAMYKECANSLFSKHEFDTDYFKGFLSHQTFFCGRV